jgi:hypothetical protein
MNIEFKGTPGIWRVDKRAYACVTSDSGVIANCGSRFSNVDWKKLHKENINNALLISKAPELLQMLDRLLSALDEVELSPDTTEVIVPIMADAEKLLKEATEL